MIPQPNQGSEMGRSAICFSIDRIRSIRVAPLGLEPFFRFIFGDMYLNFIEIANLLIDGNNFVRI
jgi:hypothetical protein